MSLNVTPVSKCLDKKLLVFGFEIPDLLAVFILLAILNFSIGSAGALAHLLTWVPPLLLALLLRYGKRGKPENYLLHLARYHFTPGINSAFQYPTHFKFPPQRKDINYDE